MTWQTLPFSNVVNIISGGTPKTTVSDYWGGEIPWLSVADFNHGYRWARTAEKKITDLGLRNSATQLLQPGQIIISARGTVGVVAQVALPMAFNQSCYGLTGKDGIDNNFLYYLTKTAVRELQHIGHGAVFNTITRETFDSINVKVPDFDTQKEIANILGTLDDKIDLNRRMNETLEAMARAIFKDWFVDFGPTRAKMEGRAPYLAPDLWALFPDRLGDDGLPVGWEMGTISDFAEITSGKRPDIKSDLPNPHMNIPLYGGAGIMAYVSDFLYNRPILLTGRVGTLGVINRVVEPCWPSDNTLVVLPKEHMNIGYLYFTLREVDMANLNRGGVQPLVTQTDLKNQPAIKGSPEVFLAFSKICNSMLDKKDSNIQEQATLASTRDMLLPKLMTGEVRVNGEGAK